MLGHIFLFAFFPSETIVPETRSDKNKATYIILLASAKTYKPLKYRYYYGSFGHCFRIIRAPGFSALIIRPE